MSHFSDIGYIVSSEEEMSKLLQSWVVDDKSKAVKQAKGLFVFTRKVGDIWNFVKIKTEKNNSEITSLSMSYTNPNASEVKFSGVQVDDKLEFPIIRIENKNDHFPFWFCLHSTDKKLKLKPKKDYKIYITSFAENIEIKDATPPQKPQVNIDIQNIKIDTENLQFADESYMSAGAFSGNEYDTAFVSGIIKAWKKEINLETNIEFFVIDTECLGLNFRIVADKDMIDENLLANGKVVCGEFWNTCFISTQDK